MPIRTGGISDEPMSVFIPFSQIAAFDKRLKTHSLHESPRLDDLMSGYGKKADLMKEAEAAKQELKGAKSLLQMVDLKCMKRVLRRLGYCTAADVIEVRRGGKQQRGISERFTSAIKWRLKNLLKTVHSILTGSLPSPFTFRSRVASPAS